MAVHRVVVVDVLVDVGAPCGEAAAGSVVDVGEAGGACGRGAVVDVPPRAGGVVVVVGSWVGGVGAPGVVGDCGSVVLVLVVVVDGSVVVVDVVVVKDCGAAGTYTGRGCGFGRTQIHNTNVPTKTTARMAVDARTPLRPQSSRSVITDGPRDGP